MRKWSLAAVVLTLTCVFGCAAGAEEHLVGVGYQGMFSVSSYETGVQIGHGVSLRGWWDRIGWEGNFLQAGMEVENDYYRNESDVWLLAGKIVYAPVVNTHSRLYVGVEAGWGEYDLYYRDGEGDITIFGPLFGAEYSFKELPEMGFNWEVGYKLQSFKDSDEDTDIDGLFISLGVHYYIK